MIELDLRIAAEAWSSAIPNLTETCQRALDAAATQMATDGEVSLLLTDDDEIQALNRDWRDKDKPTDVLSFPSTEMDRPFLGDIAVSLGVTRGDAETKQIALDQHLSHLIIHGLLHLLGHDHNDDTEAAEMERLEIAALASLGWPDPYK
ncbi:MAG: rRNA maturation RNase YbeY [Pseudomonadota bacterium]